MSTRGRLLPLAERDRLREAGGPLREADLDALDLAALPVVEVDGGIVAYWPAFFALHLEPLWIADDQRGKPSVVKALLAAMSEALQQIGKPVAFAVLDPATPMEAMAERLGFARVPGDLYYVMQPASEPVEG